MKLLAAAGSTDGMKIVRKLPRRVVLLVVVGLLAALVGAGIALARGKTSPVGTGVVVIDTNLAYQGSAVVSSALSEPELLAHQARRLRKWIDAL